jgi:hypothetical protein
MKGRTDAVTRRRGDTEKEIGERSGFARVPESPRRPVSASFSVRLHP